MPHLDCILLCSNFCIDINILQMSAFTPKEWYPTLPLYSWKKWFSWFSCGIKALVSLSACAPLTSELISYQIWRSLKKDHLTKADSQTQEGLHKWLNSGEVLFEFPCLKPQRIPTDKCSRLFVQLPFPLLPSLYHLGRLGETKVLKAQVRKQPGFDSFPVHKSTWFIPYEIKGRTKLGA